MTGGKARRKSVALLGIFGLWRPLGALIGFWQYGQAACYEKSSQEVAWKSVFLVEFDQPLMSAGSCL